MIEFKSPGDAAKHFAAMSAQMAKVEIASVEFVMSAVFKKEAKAEIGHYQAGDAGFPDWAQLAPSTQSQRVALGFTPNDPLLRSGELRDSIESQVYSPFPGLVKGEMGSDSLIAFWQELGTSRIPPRSFIGRAAFRKAADAVEVVAGNLVWTLRGLKNFRSNL